MITPPNRNSPPAEQKTTPIFCESDSHIEGMFIFVGTPSELRAPCRRILWLERGLLISSALYHGERMYDGGVGRVREAIRQFVG